MVQPVRVTSYRNYGDDGRSYAEMKINNKKEVIVMMPLGVEPRVINDVSDYLDVDNIIIKLADHIKAARREQAAKKNPPKKTKAAKKKVKKPKKKVKRKVPKKKSIKKM